MRRTGTSSRYTSLCHQQTETSV
ncbi:unnamed protein product [Coregonus sp. 'balchen']|nr:unnamed protein product [Coregonus sp. 'balchen']